MKLLKLFYYLNPLAWDEDMGSAKRITPYHRKLTKADKEHNIWRFELSCYVIAPDGKIKRFGSEFPGMQGFDAFDIVNYIQGIPDMLKPRIQDAVRNAYPKAA